MDITNRASRTSTKQYTLSNLWTLDTAALGDHVPHYHESISARYLARTLGEGHGTWPGTDPNSFITFRIAVKE